MSKFKTVGLIALVVLLSIMNYVWADTTNLTDEKAVINSFKATGANFLEMNMNFNSKINDQYLNKEQLSTLGLELVEALNIQGKLVNDNQFFELNNNADEKLYSFSLSEGNNYNQLVICGQDDANRTITAIVVSYKDISLGTEETDLYIDVIEYQEIENLEPLKTKIEDIYDKYNKKSKISTCITGTFKGKLSSSEIYKKISIALQTVDGYKVEGLVDDNLTSISAFTSNITEYLYTGNKKMNLNIAMRYNEYEDSTYIWIGTPIITTGY